MRGRAWQSELHAGQLRAFWTRLRASGAACRVRTGPTGSWAARQSRLDPLHRPAQSTCHHRIAHSLGSRLPASSDWPARACPHTTLYPGLSRMHFGMPGQLLPGWLEDPRQCGCACSSLASFLHAADKLLVPGRAWRSRRKWSVVARMKVASQDTSTCVMGQPRPGRVVLGRVRL